MFTEIVQKEDTFVMYVTHTKDFHDEEFIVLSLDDEIYRFKWMGDFDSTLDIVCRDLSSHPKVKHIGLINTEAEIYVNGKHKGYSSPVIFKLEIYTQGGVFIDCF